MLLETRRWGNAGGRCVVCVHGIAQHGGIFDGLGRALSARGFDVLAVDLRGHGASDRLPPWNAETHVADLFETLDAAGVERATFVGHSFGGMLAARAGACAPDRVERLALLEPGFDVPPERALRSAELERLDWSFATVDGAINAALSSDAMIAPPRETVAAFVREDVREGPDGRLRFSFSPSAVVVAWSEVTLPAPPIARLPTLIVLGEAPLVDGDAHERRYRDELGDLVEFARVPNGHNMLWESPTETISAIEGFLAA